MNLPIITPIANLLTTAVNGFVEVKKIKTEGKVKLEQAKVDAVVRKVENDQVTERDYDTTAINGMQYSWKDEYLVIIFSLPFIGSFIPRVQDYVMRGWDYISKAPEWYQWSFIGIVSATFGIRWLTSKKVDSLN